MTAKRRRTKKRMFDGGPLDQPMVRLPLRVFEVAGLGGDHSIAQEQDIERQRGEKMKLLSEHFGSTNYRQLALALAERFVPGFSVVDARPRPRGAPQQWDDLEYIRLLTDVEAIRIENGWQQQRRAIRRYLGRDRATDATVRYYENRLAEAKNTDFNPFAGGWNEIDEAEKGLRITTFRNTFGQFLSTRKPPSHKK
jgi:hypothetical protein